MIRKTQCARDCPDACYLDAEVKSGKVIAVKGGQDNPVTSGFVCPRGVGDRVRIYSDQRVLHPRIRDGPKPEFIFRNATWDSALDTISLKLKECMKKYGPESILLLDYSGNTGLITSMFSTRIWKALGATHTDHSICSLSGHEALRLHYGLSYGLTPESLPDRRIVTFWGFNAKVSSIHQWALALKAREKGAPIIAVDPRKSETAEAADIWLSPRPGTDVALAYGVARRIIELDHVDDTFIGGWTTGYEAYKNEAMSWAPAKIEDITGVSWSQIEAFADLLVENRPGAMMVGIGFQKSIQGAEAIRAVSLLPALLGEHRGFYYTNSRGRLIDYGYLSGEKLASCNHKTVSQVAIGKHLEAGDFKFVYIQGMNPALTLPDLSAVRRGLSKDDVFVTVVDTHMTETCGYADVILPAPTFYEKDDMVVPDCHQYTRFNRRVIEPLGESLPESWMMREIATRLKLSEPWLYEEPLKALEISVADGLEGANPFGLIKGSNLKIKEKGKTEYQTPSGKIEFYSTSTKDDITPLPRQLPIERSDGWFTLLNSAQPQWTHSQFRDVYGEIPLVVWLNGEDAETLGVNEGDNVFLINDFGQIEVIASIRDGVKRGVIWSPRPLLDRSGRAQNELTPGTSQLLGGGPYYNSVMVRVQKRS